MGNEFSFIIYGMIAVIVMAFIFSYIDLNRFKKCYDVNFQEEYCQKYLKED